MVLNKKAQTEVIEKIEAMTLSDEMKKSIYKNLGIKKERKELLCVETTVRVWRRILGSITIMCNEVTFNFGKDNIDTNSVDPAHVMMMHLKLYADFFKQYSIYKKSVPIGLPCDKFLEKLKHLKITDKVCIRLFDDDISTLHISIDRGDIKINKILKLIDTATLPGPRKPNLRLPHKMVVEMPVKELFNLFKNIDSGSDHTKWISDYGKDEFRIACPTDNEGPNGEPLEETVKIPVVYEQTNIVGKWPAKVVSLFANDYMEITLAIIKTFSDKLGIQLGMDNPIELSFSMCGDSDGVEYYPFKEDSLKKKPRLMEMEILLAPRIETDPNIVDDAKEKDEASEERKKDGRATENDTSGN